ncbi:ADP-ribosyl-[dinitrogen reductase] hydrolase [Rubrivivax gelatinosus]|nr:ADP-ribosyl-[dinitrogen reductase] hydrolase [Rubrivivax gelatinosus]
MTEPLAERIAAAGGLAAVADRALGAYLGLALGDALGATVEFMMPREIVHRWGVHRRIVGGGWLKLKPGEVTDDTTMSLALGDALLLGAREGRPWDLRLVAEAYVGWLRSKPVDCGNTCRRGIQRYLLDGSFQGPYNEGDGGNGAAMRNLPVALATLGDDARFERLSLAQARFTHNHQLSDAATLALGRLTQALLLGERAEQTATHIAAIVEATPAFRFTPYRGRASAYVVDTMQTVLHFFSTRAGFEDAVVDCVNQGEDADTNGALVGMLAGARCGASRLPRDWLARLKPAVRVAVIEQASALVALALAPPAGA